MDFRKQFVVARGKRPKLSEKEATFVDPTVDIEMAKERLEKNRQRLADLQARINAESKRAVLVCLQGLDASGKDGTVAHIFTSMNPQGCTATSFKVPTPDELAHDFLWRIHQHTPGHGSFAIFNRSHYESVLVERIHNLVPKQVWSKRYDQINAFEDILVSAGTTVLKFFLHISKDEQLRRFKSRLDDRSKWWKLSIKDYEEREYWDAYKKAYQDVFERCSTKQAPWYVIPSDQKWFRNLAISEIIADSLDELKIEPPEPAADIEAIRKAFDAAAKERAH